MLICKFGRRVLGFVFFSLQKILPPTVQTNLGGRNFASCVALGRIFGATFRNACPPPASSSAPSALRRESRAARRRGDRAKGYAEIPTQGNARREVPPPTSGLSGCCLVTANILQTCFHHVPANLYGQYLTRDALVPLFRPPCRPKSMLERQQEQSFVSGFFLGHILMNINIEFGGKRGSRKVSS